MTRVWIQRLAMAIGLLAATHARGFAQPAAPTPTLRYNAFVDIAYLADPDDPPSQTFRYRGTTPRLNRLVLDMTGAALTKLPSDASRWGFNVSAHGGEDSKAFGFSPSAPPVRGGDRLSHFGPTSVSYLAPVGRGTTVQAGIFNSLIGYDGLYAKDNFSYTRPWGADFTPYLMLGVNAQYPITERLTTAVGVINGYFHLAHANDAPNVVGQVAFHESERLSLKQTVLVGPDQANTAPRLWRVLSDTIVERRTPRFVSAFEYQWGHERVNAPGSPSAVWMSAQLPLHWIAGGRWSVTARPEWAWDRDGRWIAGAIGSGQTIVAMATTIDYRVSHRQSTTTVRLEHRVDRAHGPGGGFFSTPDSLSPRQHLWIAALILALDSGGSP